MLKKYLNSMSPARLFVFSFLFLILTGTILLLLPKTTYNGISLIDALPFSSKETPLSLVDALFTSASAVCVTGLTVVDLGKELSLFGKTITFFLFQIGGLGIVTFALLFFELLGRNISTVNRDLLKTSFLPQARPDLFRIIHWVLLFTFVIEFSGAVLLFLRFKNLFPFWDAAGYAVYHAVSAFNNCGYALFSDSLVLFKQDYLVNITVIILIFFGGIGFYTLYEIVQIVLGKKSRLSLNARLILFTSLFLIIFGAAFFLFFENHNQLEGLTTKDKVLAATFQSVTARTCGFNTIDISSLTNASILILFLLMFIGASPGSTGGGIKTSSFAVIILLIISALKGEENISLKNRSLSAEDVRKAIGLVFSAILLIFISVSLLIFFADSELKFSSDNRGLFIKYLFEVVSAFGTVGLSMGITPELNVLQKLIIIITMFIGRVGPLTFVYSLHSRKKGLKYAEEKVMIG